MEPSSNFRDTIGKTISLWVMISTGVLGVLGVILAILYIKAIPGKEGLTEAKDILQFVFSALLPMWGTWIGTVLAYYFSKENFEAANRSVRELVNQVSSADKLKSVKATDVMMPYDKIKKRELATGESEDALLVKQLYDDLIKQNIRRSLVFRDGQIVFALHKSILGEFILRTNATATTSISDLKGDNDKDVKNAILNGSQTIRKDATLLEAKLIMDTLPGCQDVFVTETGKKTEPVLGWISNVDVFNRSKA